VREGPRRVPAGGLLCPAFAAALALLLFNDHFWKGVGPPAITGKLSDVAILIVGPLALQGGVEWLTASLRGRWRPRRDVLVASAVVMGAIMALINTWAPAGAAYRVGLAALQWPALATWELLASGHLPPLRPVHLTPDVTDLWTVPVAALAVAIGWRRAARETRAPPPPQPVCRPEPRRRS